MPFPPLRSPPAKQTSDRRRGAGTARSIASGANVRDDREMPLFIGHGTRERTTTDLLDGARKLRTEVTYSRGDNSASWFFLRATAPIESALALSQN